MAHATFSCLPGLQDETQQKQQQQQQYSENMDAQMQQQSEEARQEQQQQAQDQPVPSSDRIGFIGAGQVRIPRNSNQFCALMTIPVPVRSFSTTQILPDT